MRNNQQQITCRVIYHKTNLESQNVSFNTDLGNCNEYKCFSIHNFPIESKYIFSKGRSLPYCINSMLVKYIGHGTLYNTMLTLILTFYIFLGVVIYFWSVVFENLPDIVLLPFAVSTILLSTHVVDLPPEAAVSHY